MPEFEFSRHAKEMLKERNIEEDWVWRVLDSPEKKQMGSDENMHYTKAIEERGGKILHVVVNQAFQPNRIVTLFFDRRLLETK